MNPVLIGLIAGAFTSFSSLPQIVYVVRTRSMKDISLTTLAMFATGNGLWLFYGVVIHALPIVAWNAISLTLYLTQLSLKLTLGSRDGRSARVENAPARTPVAALSA